MARLRHLTTDRDWAKSRRSRRRPRPGWYLWPATRPRSTAILHELWTTSFWPAMRASADRRRVTNVSPVWPKAPCASFSVKRKKSALGTRYYLERRDAEFGFRDGGSSVCLPRGPQVLKKPLPRRRNRRSRSRSSLTTRSLEDPGHRHDGTGFAASARPPCELRGDHEYKRHGRRSACWPGSICSPARSTRSSGSVTAAASSSNSSSFFDATYPASTAIKLILDNLPHTFRGKHRPGLTPGRQAASTPPYSTARLLAQLYRGLLLHVRLLRFAPHPRDFQNKNSSDRIMALPSMTLIDNPVVHKWSYRLEDAA